MCKGIGVGLHCQGRLGYASKTAKGFVQIWICFALNIMKMGCKSVALLI